MTISRFSLLICLALSSAALGQAGETHWSYEERKDAITDEVSYHATVEDASHQHLLGISCFPKEQHAFSIAVFGIDEVSSARAFVQLRADGGVVANQLWHSQGRLVFTEENSNISQIAKLIRTAHNLHARVLADSGERLADIDFEVTGADPVIRRVDASCQQARAGAVNKQGR